MPLGALVYKEKVYPEFSYLLKKSKIDFSENE